MKKLLYASTLAATVAFSGIAFGQDKSVEVLHWWTSGGEAAAVGVLKKDLEAKGYTWQDMAVAGGGGEAANTTLRARVTAGDPPAAAQLLAMALQDWAKEDLLGDLNDLAAKEGWDKVVPQAVQNFAKYDGKWVAAPINIHRPNWLWANAKVFKDNGLTPPATWDEFNTVAEALKAKGIIPLAVGGEHWQETIIFDDVVVATGGPEFYRKVAIEADDASLRSDTMLKVFEQLAKIRGYLDPGFPGRAWNLATSMVLRGEAGMQLMGDWAKGEITNANLKPGVDILCVAAPGTEGTFLFNTDFFAMFKLSDEKKAGQEALASSIMAPSFQESFNIVKGSIPVRTDVPGDKFDPCGQKSMADIKAAQEKGTLMGDLASGHAQPPAIQSAYFDLVLEFFSSDMSPADAVTKLADGVAQAKSSL